MFPRCSAYFVVALNHDMSVSSIIDPIKKIEALLAKRLIKPTKGSGCEGGLPF